MLAAKINDELIKQYYAANPPYMSVVGLKDIGRKMVNKLKNILGKEIIPGFKGKFVHGKDMTLAFGKSKRIQFYMAYSRTNIVCQSGTFKWK